MGMFGNSPYSDAQQTAILFSGLRDLLASATGRPDGYVEKMLPTFDKLNQKKQYQDTISGLFGAQNINNVQATPQMPMAGAGAELANRQYAGAYNQPTYGGAIGGLSNETQDMLARMLPTMDPNQGMSMLFNSITSGQERADRKSDVMQQNAWQNQAADRNRQQTVQDNTIRPMSVEEKARYGFDAKTPVFKDGFGRPIVTQDPNVMTPYQQQSLANDRAQIGIAAMNANKGAAAPSGYRYAAGGNLEFIPGGPADPAVAGRGTGKPTEDQAKNAQLYTLSKQMLPQVLKNFDEMSGFWNSAGKAASNIPLIGPPEAAVTSSGFQQADKGLNSLVANFLYSTSGATATPDEVKNRADTVRPKLGDSADTKALKRQAIIDMVESIKLRASPQLLQQQPANANPNAPKRPSVSNW